MTLRLILLTFFTVFVTGCVKEEHQSLSVAKVDAYYKPYFGKKSDLVVGSVDNKSSHNNGVFSANTDKLGSQGKSILVNHLQQTHRFNIMDRENLELAKNEAEISGVEQSLEGAKYIISGKIVEFGRKEVGDQQLFGILGRSKTQVAYAKVNIQIIDTHTSKIIFTTEGAGEYQLSNRELAGFGGVASYDSTLNGKVLDLAIREATNRLVESLESNVCTLS